MAKANNDKKYSKLLGAVDYDHEAAEQLAAALNEVSDLELRLNQLKTLINENEELHQFVWRTANNEVIAIHKIEDDHLANIMLHLLRTQRAIPRAVRGEAMNRNLVIPARVPIDWDDPVVPANRRLTAIDREDIL